LYPDKIKQRAFDLWQIGYEPRQVWYQIKHEFKEESDINKLAYTTIIYWVNEWRKTLEGRMEELARFGFEHFYNNIQDIFQTDIADITKQINEEQDADNRLKLRLIREGMLKELYIIKGDGQLVNALRALRAKKQLAEQQQSS
jgi:hypothetical protein